MRAFRPRFWGIIAITAVLGVCANLAIAYIPLSGFDPVEYIWQNSIQTGDAAAESLRYVDAERQYRIAVAIADIGHFRPGLLAQAKQGVATALWAQGRYAEAEASWCSAIEITQSEYGATSERLIDPLNDLAGRYRAAGRDSLSDVCESRVVSIARSLEPTYLRAVALQESQLPS